MIVDSTNKTTKDISWKFTFYLSKLYTIFFDTQKNVAEITRLYNLKKVR